MSSLETCCLIFEPRCVPVLPTEWKDMRRLGSPALTRGRRVKLKQGILVGLGHILSVVTPCLNLSMAAFTRSFIASPFLCHKHRLIDSSTPFDILQALRWNSFCFSQVPINQKVNSAQLSPHGRMWGACGYQGLSCPPHNPFGKQIKCLIETQNSP